jgi:zinc-ribbon domain
VRCPRCGNENQATNRFCSMCGATLLPVSANVPPGASQRASKPSNPLKPAPPPAQAATPVPPVAPPPITPVVTARASTPASPLPSEEAPAISGPSFLGLNDSASSERSRAGLSIDTSGTSSRNLDYLLEDDEEPRSGGAGKWILMLVALALAVGFGYMRWKGQDFSWLSSGPKKPAATTDSGDPATSSNTQPNSSSPDYSTPNSSRSGNSAPAAVTPTQPPSGTAPLNSPVSNSGASNSASKTAAAASPPSTNPANSPTTSAATSAGNVSAGDSASNPGTAANPAAANPGGGSSTASRTPAKDSNDDTSDSSDAETAKPAPATKPAAASRPVQAADPVVEAQKYIYGKGARQDCERGLRLLKPSADQSNPKAMIEMGALYSAGLCTPRDLPTAYRWFALALRKDPNNQSVQDDLQQLWSEMTQPERQLAIRLSQ